MNALPIFTNPLSDELSAEVKLELGLTYNSIARMYNDYQQSNALFESHFVVDEPFEKALMLKVAREFFKYGEIEMEKKENIRIGNDMTCRYLMARSIIRKQRGCYE